VYGAEIIGVPQLQYTPQGYLVVAGWAIVLKDEE
jgi:hypothetical protein